MRQAYAPLELLTASEVIEPERWLRYSHHTSKSFLLIAIR